MLRLHAAAVAATDCLLTVADAAEYMNVTTKWIYDHVESGYLPCRRVGRMIRFITSELDAWLADCVSGMPFEFRPDGTRLMTSCELEAYLDVSRSWVYEARRSKRLPHFKLDGQLRFSRRMVDTWLRENSTQTSTHATHR